MPVESADVALGHNGGSFENLPENFYQDCPVTRLTAYRVTKQDQKDKTKTYIATNIDTWFFSGEVRENDEGEEIKLNVNYAFQTLSFHERSNFRKLLTTLGINLTSDKPTLDYDFVGDYAGHSFLDLPLYPGTGPKADYAVELTHFKVDGQEILGRRASLDVGTNDKGYNIINSFVKSRKKPLDLTAVTSQEYLRWKAQKDAMGWAAAYEVDGKPLFADDESLNKEYTDLYKKYEESLGEGEQPVREDFYRHWYDAVNAWALGDAYDVNSGNLPF